jgi:hypothetical protein
MLIMFLMRIFDHKKWIINFIIIENPFFLRKCQSAWNYCENNDDDDNEVE